MKLPSNEDIKEVIEFYSNDFFKDLKRLIALTNVAKAYLEASAHMPDKKADGKRSDYSDMVNDAYNDAVEACTLAHMKIVAEKDKTIEEMKEQIKNVWHWEGR